MVATLKPLMTMTAADLMTQTLVIVPQEMSLRGAAHLLAQEQVSGAPVVDAEGRCVGVLSATDFLHVVEKGERAAQRCACRPESVCSPWQIIASDVHPEEIARNYMTTDVVRVGPGVSIGEVAQMLLDAHIHRVIVVDAEQRPIGVVSSTDVLAALATTAHSYPPTGGSAGPGGDDLTMQEAANYL